MPTQLDVRGVSEGMAESPQIVMVPDDVIVGFSREEETCALDVCADHASNPMPISCCESRLDGVNPMAGLVEAATGRPTEIDDPIAQGTWHSHLPPFGSLSLWDHGNAGLRHPGLEVRRAWLSMTTVPPDTVGRHGQRVRCEGAGGDVRVPTS